MQRVLVYRYFFLSHSYKIVKKSFTGSPLVNVIKSDRMQKKSFHAPLFLL